VECFHSVTYVTTTRSTLCCLGIHLCWVFNSFLYRPLENMSKRPSDAAYAKRKQVLLSIKEKVEFLRQLDKSALVIPSLNRHRSSPFPLPRTLHRSSVTTWPTFSQQHQWHVTFSVFHFPSTHKWSCPIFPKKGSQRLTRDHTWWNIGLNNFLDILFTVLDKMNHPFVNTITAYVCGSIHFPVQLLQHLNFL
jgi:hypothetical protein